MALLTSQQAKAACSDWAKKQPISEPAPLNKVELFNALQALDQWLEDNEIAINQALTPEARTTLTIKQKARLLKFVITARYQVA